MIEDFVVSSLSWDENGKLRRVFKIPFSMAMVNYLVAAIVIEVVYFLSRSFAVTIICSAVVVAVQVFMACLFFWCDLYLVKYYYGTTDLEEIERMFTVSFTNPN